MRRNTIYHYCGMESFHSIICNRTIRLSNAFKTNDFFEVKWILELLALPQISTTIESFKREYLYWLSSHIRPHIACFSKSGDLLSQWRGYANDGTGVAIGFNRDYLEGISNLDNKETILKDVIYDKNEQKMLIDKLIKTSEIEKFHELNINFEGLASTVFIQYIADYGIVFKHFSFTEEQEVRLIHGHGEMPAETNSLQYRASADNLISFVDIPLQYPYEVPVINEIILGPKCKAEINDVREFVQQKFGIENNIVVKRSSSSYR